MMICKAEFEKLVGTEIKVFRVRSGLTQLELAKKLSVTQGTLSFWELGKKSIKYYDFYRIKEICENNLTEEAHRK